MERRTKAKAGVAGGNLECEKLSLYKIPFANITVNQGEN